MFSSLGGDLETLARQKKMDDALTCLCADVRLKRGADDAADGQVLVQPHDFSRQQISLEGLDVFASKMKTESGLIQPIGNLGTQRQRA